MRRSAIGALVMTLALAACGGAAPATNPPVPGAGGTKTTAPGGGGSVPTAPEETFSFSFPPYVPPTAGPTQWLVRVFNGYTPAPGTAATPIDVFRGFAPQASDKPVVTVPFGGLSEPFDPGDDGSGSYYLSYYPAGVTNHDDSLMGDDEPTDGSGRITLELGVSSLQADGTYNAGLVNAFEKVPDLPLYSPLETPAASGQAVLRLDSYGIPEDQWDAAHANQLIYVAADGTCLKANGDTSGFPSGSFAGLGSASLAVTPGKHAVTLYAFPNGGSGDPCKTGTKVLDGVTVDLAAGQFGTLWLASSDGKDIKWAFAPYMQ